MRSDTDVNPNPMTKETSMTPDSPDSAGVSTSRLMLDHPSWFTRADGGAQRARCSGNGIVADSGIAQRR